MRASQSRARILKAAEAVFAEKGFNAAGVDEIAARAGVTKPLIYYYFRGKEDLLAGLVDGLIAAAAELVQGSFERGVDFESHQDIQRMIAVLHDFIDQRKDLVRIVLMESLKSSAADPPLFRLARALMEPPGTASNKRTAEESLHMVTEFFTGIIPIVLFMVFHERWAHSFGVDDHAIHQQFVAAFEQTHIAHHLRARG
ncbi:MAG: helix-turn-helix domain-containing protein [Candidatus Latescibacterota bacterium]|jgi:AcrR family transcriptional regulator